LYSTNANGVANASLLGQINVVVLSVFGLLIFKEKKAKEEYITLFVGLGLVTIGCILPALNPQFFPALKN
jgi:glucose uptake protein GlcU